MTRGQKLEEKAGSGKGIGKFTETNLGLLALAGGQISWCRQQSLVGVLFRWPLSLWNW
jgi:hypothetical protein